MGISVLSPDLRKLLEKTVKLARCIAESGARKTLLEELSVGHATYSESMTPSQRILRKRLRFHARQLGDLLEEHVQHTDRLVRECAYEHWHRMLFARFLAENNLLIEPNYSVAITLDDAQEIAREQGIDVWKFVANCSERMLPQIFRKGDPVLDIVLPPETRFELEGLLQNLPSEIFLKDDSLGWVYQFWQADRKDAINVSGKKIGADELPAVTQLFTEDYMVLFLLHNTLGAWWAGKVLKRQPKLSDTAKSEEELRAACKVGKVEFRYLRFTRDTYANDSEAHWRPAAGTFDGWPRTAKEVTVLDPCMGSGHFLIFALPILVAMRAEEEELSQEDAVMAVLQDNLYGLEIDPRCTQIAEFNLALAAWRILGKYHILPPLNLACSGLAIGVTKTEWLKIAEEVAKRVDIAQPNLFGPERNLITIGTLERMRNGLERLHDLFAQAPSLGSLIDPKRIDAHFFSADFNEIEKFIAPILTLADDDEITETASAAQKMAKAAGLLCHSFTLIATNVPYLKRGNQEDDLQKYCDSYFRNSKGNLACTFLSRILELCEGNGTCAIVVINELLSIGGYKKLRRDLLLDQIWNMTVRLGPRAFGSIQGEVVNVSLLILTNKKPCNLLSWTASMDTTEFHDPIGKLKSLLQGEFKHFNQSAQLDNPDHRIILEEMLHFPLLNTYGIQFGKGSTTGDSPHYHRNFWELPSLPNYVVPWLDSPQLGDPWSGRSLILITSLGDSHLKEERGCMIGGQNVWGHHGIVVNKVNFHHCIYIGEVFDDNIGVLSTDDIQLALATLCYVESGEYARNLKKIDQTLKITAATLTKVPFDRSRWQTVAAERYPHGLPKAQSNDPKQWIFEGHPKSRNPLQVAIARLLGYRWPRQTGSSFPDCPAIKADNLEKHTIDDGIACLSAMAGKPPAHERLNALLADAFGSEWSSFTLNALLTDVECTGKTLDDWLRDKFFSQHCDIYDDRPFIWHVWDGRRDGFHALVNYHVLASANGVGLRTLEKLIYTYLGDWIARQEAEQKAGVDGADARLAAALYLKLELEKIRDGEAPYDIFVRWKPLHQQPIRWEPDINDGIKVNIRPFMTAKPWHASTVGACILRSTPKNMKWEKPDRGTEPHRNHDDYPWFWGWDQKTKDFLGGKEFDGRRWNDLHYTTICKQTARERFAEASNRP